MESKLEATVSPWRLQEDRQEQHERVLHRLFSIADGLDMKESLGPFLNSETLESLSIQVSDPLQVDEDHPIDFAPRFFTPFKCQDGLCFEELVESSIKPDFWYEGPITDFWPERCTEGDKCLWRRDCSEGPGIWHVGVMGHQECNDGIMTLTSWRYCQDFPRRCDPFHPEYLPVYDSNYHRQCRWRNQQYTGEYEHRGPRHQFCSLGVIELEEGDDRPHIAGTIVDSTNATGAVMRSEIEMILYLMKHQLGNKCYLDHHTIPVLLFSFQHDETARITQAHVSNDKLVLRQSRLLDLSSDSGPTEDSYLLLRWIANEPVGTTGYPEPTDEAALVASRRRGDPLCQTNRTGKLQA